MRQLGWICVALLASVLTTRAFAQGPSWQRLTVPDQTPASDQWLPSYQPQSYRPTYPQQDAVAMRLPDPTVTSPAITSRVPSDAPTDAMSTDTMPTDDLPSLSDMVGEITGDDEMPDELVPPRSLEEFIGYRHGESSLDWMIGGGDEFGVFSLGGSPYLTAGEESGITTGVQIHFLDGPARTEMPPRAFDFGIGYQCRQQMGNFSYDLAASVVASSDFEGSARKGIRFPSHAVGFLRMNPMTELVFGIDYLDRGHIKLLPVGGLIWVPNPDVRLEIVFPRPRVAFRLTDEHHLFVRGELGGNTWAVRRYQTINDLASYRDLRVGIGVESFDKKGKSSIFEIAYLFSRRLEFTSGQGDYDPGDTVMLRSVYVY